MRYRGTENLCVDGKGIRPTIETFNPHDSFVGGRGISWRVENGMKLSRLLRFWVDIKGRKSATLYVTLNPLVLACTRHGEPCGMRQLLRLNLEPVNLNRCLCGLQCNETLPFMDRA